MTRTRKGEQFRTRPVSDREVMSDPAFALGVADARNGRPMHRDYDLWETDAQWNYDRGRQFAVLTPRTIPVWRGGALNPLALAWFKRHGDVIL